MAKHTLQLGTMEKAKRRKNNQITGNIGLYYACYQLSQRGWNVMPTARNARGIDIIAFSQDGRRKLAIQVKTLSFSAPVPLGSKLDSLFGDFFIICRNVATGSPECFIMTPAQVRKRVHRGVKGGKEIYWLQPKDYVQEDFGENWKLIGTGIS